MEELHLKSQIREERGKRQVSKARRSGFIPAVIYGQGKKTQNLKVSSHDINTLLHEHRAENIVIKLDISQGHEKRKERNVLIKEIQYDPVTDQILHLDFYEISLTKSIQVKIPLVAKGEAIGIKQDGGSLEHLLWELDVECLPTNIPEKIEVDITNLKIGDDIHIRDLTMPHGVKLLHEPDVVVLSIAPPVKEEAPTEVSEEAVSAEPEVIKKAKEEEAQIAEEKKPEAPSQKGKSAKEEEEKQK